MNFIKNGRVYDVMPCADSFNDIHEIKCGQAEEKLEAGGDEKLIFNHCLFGLRIESPPSGKHLWATSTPDSHFYILAR